MRHRSNVLLPPPLGPIMNRRSCRPISRSRPLKTCTAPCAKLLCRPLIRTKFWSDITQRPRHGGGPGVGTECCGATKCPPERHSGEGPAARPSPVGAGCRLLLAAGDHLVHVELAELGDVAFGNRFFEEDVQRLDLVERHR